MKKALYIAGIFITVSSLFLSSCVPSRQFEELTSKHKQCEDEVSRLKSENQSLSTKGTELDSKFNELERSMKQLQQDTSATGVAYRRISELYNELTKSYDKLLANNDRLMAGNTAETKKIIAQLQETQEELQRKEDSLKKTGRDLATKEQKLNELNLQLMQREAKIAEMQGILRRKDSAVVALRNTVADALLGFKDKGINVAQKNGKVYVSLEEQLLFATGKTEVDKKGQEALKQLAQVLEKNSDINVLIEGHTDNQPILGGPIKDNWELSVMRATAIIRIITTNSKVDPKRLTAAGRSAYEPIDTANTPEARKKNRRTEIILTPKLDELFRVIDPH